MQNNFCINCGSKIIHNAKFCFNCGTPVATVISNQIEINMESALESFTNTVDHTPAIEFQVLGRTLSFSSDLVKYNELRSLFSTHATKYKTSFLSYYQSNVKSFNDLFDKAIPTFIECVNVSLKFGVSVLMKYDVDYVDLDKLADLAANDIDILKYISPFMEASEQIEEYAENLSSYRNLSRAGRSRWQGGGFGLSGAIKGALTASVLNIGTGMIRGIGDSLTNAGDRAKIASMEKEIFVDHRTVALLSEGVYECCFGVFYSVWRMLEEEERIPFIEFNSEKLNARANNLIAHYASDESLYNKVVDALCECIQNFPYSVSYFSNLYSIAKDSRQDILILAVYFGLEPDYKEAIISLDRTRLKSIKEMPDDTLPNIDKKIKELEQLQKGNPDLDVSALRSTLIEKKNLISLQIQRQAPFKSSLDQVEYIRKPIDEAIRNQNLEYVWVDINNGNIYAEYAMAKYYDTVCHNCIEKYNIREMINLLGDVQKRADNGNIYAKYLMGSIEYKMYGEDLRNEDKKKEAAKVMIDMATKGNVSAIAIQGFWGSHGYNDATTSVSSAITLLEDAANRQQPMALAWLGSYYRTGMHGLTINKEKAEMLLQLAAAYDHPYGKKELEKFHSGSTSS